VIGEKHDPLAQHMHFAQKRYHWVEAWHAITNCFLVLKFPIGFALCKIKAGIASMLNENSE